MEGLNNSVKLKCTPAIKRKGQFKAAVGWLSFSTHFYLLFNVSNSGIIKKGSSKNLLQFFIII